MKTPLFERLRDTRDRAEEAGARLDRWYTDEVIEEIQQIEEGFRDAIKMIDSLRTHDEWEHEDTIELKRLSAIIGE